MKDLDPRFAVGDVRACLEHLRDADRLLDSAPRTESAELAAAASDRAASAGLVGGVVGAALLVAASRAADVGGPETPGAARELAEAVSLLRKAAAELGDHPAAAQLHQATAQWEHAPVTTASKSLATIVRALYPKLRDEHGLFDAPSLTNWTVNDAEDEAAVQAAGLGLRTRAIRVAIVVAVVVAFYVLVFTR